MAGTLVWITGASSGIGAALAGTVPYDDAHVVGVSRHSPPAGTEHLAADLADPAGWVTVADHLTERLAGFSGDRVVLVHCAGTLEPMGPAGEGDAAAYARGVLLNAAAPQVLGDAFLRAVRPLACEQHLVMLTSGAARTAYEGWSGYGAGKAAVDQWVRIAGREQQRRTAPCRVVAVGPGRVDTAMQARIRETAAADFPAVAGFREAHETGSLAAPADAARGIWSLLGRELENGAVLDLRGPR